MSPTLSPGHPSPLRNELHSTLCELMRRTPYLALRSVEIELHEGVVVLKGRLPTYFLKQVAQSSLGPTLLTHRIVNEIEVLAIDPV